MPKNQVFGDAKEAIQKQVEKERYAERFLYSATNPYMEMITQNDNIVPYFKAERKTNYK